MIYNSEIKEYEKEMAIYNLLCVDNYICVEQSVKCVMRINSTLKTLCFNKKTLEEKLELLKVTNALDKALFHLKEQLPEIENILDNASKINVFSGVIK